MISLAEVAGALRCKFHGNGDLLFSSLSEPETATEDQLVLAIDTKYEEQLDTTKARAAIVGKDLDWLARGLEGIIIAKNSKLVLAKVTNLFNSHTKKDLGISDDTIISRECKIGSSPSIAPYVTIAANVRIGDNVVIENFVSIGPNVTIGDNCFIRSGTKIEADTSIGDDLICHQNVVIGSDGFSFTTQSGETIFERLNENQDSIETADNNGFERVASVGGVVIGNSVEIGANTCIDKGTLKNTTIESGTKIDNLVHIAHNVTIGKNCLICAQVGIAGSTIIGDDVIMGGQVGVADNLVVGRSSVLAGKTGLSINVPPKKFMMGNPAMEMSKNIESYKALRRLPRLQKKVIYLSKLVDTILSQLTNK